MAHEEKNAAQTEPVPTARRNFVAEFSTLIWETIFNGPIEENIKNHVRRLWIGALGGIFFALIRNGLSAVSGHPPSISQFSLDYTFGFAIAASVSGCVGAVAAWLSGQNRPQTLFFIGMVGTTILVNLVPGLSAQRPNEPSNALPAIRSPDTHPNKINFEMLLGVSVAFAQDNSSSCVGDTAFQKGFKAFFGVRQSYDKYAVVVDSGKSIEDATARMNAIKSRNPDLTLEVGPRACDSEYYPVFATPFLPLNEAKKKLEGIKSTKSDAYLYAGPR